MSFWMLLIYYSEPRRSPKLFWETGKLYLFVPRPFYSASFCLANLAKKFVFRPTIGCDAFFCEVNKADVLETSFLYVKIVKILIGETWSFEINHFMEITWDFLEAPSAWLLHLSGASVSCNLSPTEWKKKLNALVTRVIRCQIVIPNA